MWGLDYKESWAPKNGCFWTVVLEKTLESPLDCKKIKLVSPKGNQSLIFIGTTDAEAETLILRPPDVKNWLSGKDPDAGQDWRLEENRTTEDEMVGWHHLLDGHKFEQSPGIGDGWGTLSCCSPWGCKELDTTEQLNWAVMSVRLQRRSSKFRFLFPETMFLLPCQGDRRFPSSFFLPSNSLSLPALAYSKLRPKFFVLFFKYNNQDLASH